MRILSILPFSPPSKVCGGAELQMHSLHKGLLSLGIDVCVLGDISQVRLPFQKFEGVPIWGVPFPVLTAHPLRPGNIKFWQRLRTIWHVVKKEIPPPELIQACTFRQPALVAYYLAKKMAIPWVVRLACSGSYGDFRYCETNWILRLLLPPMVRSVAHIIALDAQTRTEAIAKGVPEKKITVIPNGLVFKPKTDYQAKRFQTR